MGSFFAKVLGIVNWKTTALGALSILISLSTLIPALMPFHEVLIAISVALGGAVGFVAKDFNVTGGNVPQTREAVVRALNPIESSPVDPITGTPK